MSDHKVPLTELEKSGLQKHGLPIGAPSQLSDAFRHGVKWAADELTAARDEAEKLRGRVDDITSKADALSFALVHSMTDIQLKKVHRQFCELQDCIAYHSAGAQRLRQQADAIEKGERDE